MRFGGSIYNFNSTHTRIIHNSFTYTNGGIIVGETSYDTIKNNVFDNVYFAGLRLWKCSHAEIVNNDITGHNGFGILVSDSFQQTFRTPILKKQVFFKLITPENYLKNSKLNPV